MATSYYHVDASSLIDDAIENSADTSAQGRRFEHISMYFLENDPQWGDVFDEVWLWEDAPTNNGKHDTGIDLVAHDAYEDTYWAIQCKAWRGPLSEGDLATFFANAFAPGAPYGHALLMDTASKLSSNLEQYMLENQVTRIDRNDIEQANIDWSTYTGGKPTGRKTFDPRPHQREAIDGCLDAFQSADRCRLIMACGTGKTLTSKRLQEELCPDGLVLYLAPSIALVGQNMRDWVNQTRTPIRTFVVCSDPTASKLPKGEDADVTSTLLDVPFPASTDAGTLASRLKKHRKSGETTVVFSTYQSIEAIHEAQELGIGDFDLVICDEAHRTTGVKTGGLDDSAFVRIHDNEYISAKKRLYMTATPRVFGDAAKAKAGQEGFPIASMDDEETYGPIGYRLSFGQAVERGLLSDYRIVVMTVTEDSMSETMQKLIAGSDGQIDVDDAARIAGTWKAMVEPRRAQRLSGADIDLDDGESGVDTDDRILRRVIGFAGRIRDSKGIRDEWNAVIEAYARDHADESNVSAFTGEVRHVDGTQSSAERKESLNWLRDAPDDGTECRILTNARCLSEGIDVPSLDAVVYFATRKSKVDVIQSVGRVMRKSPGKEYGYIIIPIFVPTGVDPRMALSASEVYAPVWDILQALRSHDERLNAKINAMYLGDKDALAGVIEVDVLDEDKVEAQIAAQRKKSQKEAGKHRKTNVKAPEHSEKKDETDTAAVQMTLDLYQGIKDGIVAEVVRHCGTRGYWKIWANDVGKIARKRTEQVADLIEQDAVAAKAFDGFLDGLRDTLNPGVSQQEAIEIIAQQEITQPIFELLFDDPEVVRNNPVAKGMTGTIEALHEAGLPNSMRDPVLRDVYDSVALSVKQIHDDTARQKLVRELYNDFFANAFKKTSEKMGIVYTPEQIVDAQLYIVQRALRREFGVELGTPGVHVLDPFAGTGTYMSRLIADQNLIPDDELEYKFLNDLHSNEILPMAATIMSINIEQAYHGRVGGDYVQFPGALLTDTFQMDEWGDTIDDSVFTENTERIEKQRKTDVHVIIGNPPYSSGQKNADDSAQNEPYPTLDKNIHDTYAANSINGS